MGRYPEKDGNQVLFWRFLVEGLSASGDRYQKDNLALHNRMFTSIRTVFRTSPVFFCTKKAPKGASY